VDANIIIVDNEVSFGGAKFSIIDANCNFNCKTVYSFCSIIVKVKEHEEFFPAFRSLATQLMLTLGKLPMTAQSIGRFIL
jgi:hypothetical protein